MMYPGRVVVSAGAAFGLLATVLGSTAALSAQAVADGGGEPLPRRTDIPADFSTVLCPDEASARTMLADYHQPARSGIIISHFMTGLRATGCRQDGGPIRIEKAIQRKAIPQPDGRPSEVYILYRGTDASGATVFGIVDEELNNAHPRSPLERWLQYNASDGFVTPTMIRRNAYLCATPAAAQAVVAAIPAVETIGFAPERQRAAFLKAARERNCAMAGGRYAVKAVHDSQFINLGDESGEQWTALTVTDGKGRERGLLYDIQWND